jgi:hypothetical protein
MALLPRWVRGTADPSAALGMTKKERVVAGKGRLRVIRLSNLVLNRFEDQPSPFDELRAGSPGLNLRKEGLGISSAATIALH